jgi:hypothetical protein
MNLPSYYTLYQNVWRVQEVMRGQYRFLWVLLSWTELHHKSTEKGYLLHM